jgi:hypothetical protein
MDDPLCHSCTMQGTRSSGTRQGQCCPCIKDTYSGRYK